MKNSEQKDECLMSSGNIANALLAEALIHFGSKNYRPELIEPIKNDNWMKPKGGLWTSPVNSEWGWKHWCEAENYRDCDEEKSFKVILNADAKIFVINSLEDLKNAPLINFKIGEGYQKQYLDFELLAKNYDAIWLTEKGQNETHLSYPLSLYGWDCESVLIMNPCCCSEVSQGFC